MTEIGFYHLTRSTLEQALPRLLEKILASGARAVVRIGAPERLEALDRHLWTYRPDSWLPHGSGADEHAAEQPVWLTTGIDRPNDATVLVLVDGRPHEAIEPYARVLDLFDGTDPDAVAAARERWRLARERGHHLVYWQEGDGTGWRRAAEHVPAG